MFDFSTVLASALGSITDLLFGQIIQLILGLFGGLFP